MTTDHELRDRVDRLERVGLAMLGVVAIAALLIGGFLPWYTESVDDGERTGRLFGLGLELFAPHDSADSSDGPVELVLGLSFLFLDLVTAVTVVVLVQMIARAWRQVRLARVLGGLLIACLVGAALTTGLIANAERTELHLASLVVFGAGAVLAAALLLSRELTTWWLPAVVEPGG